MIPFIIGGVALAATGYGVAKLLEDDNERIIYEDNYDSKERYYQPIEDEILGKYELAKINLYNTSFLELTTALNEIKNLPINIEIVEPMKFGEIVYSFDDLSEEVEEELANFTLILESVKKYIDSKLNLLDEIIIKKKNFKKYDEVNKKTVYKIINIFKLIDKTQYIEISNDGNTINREVLRIFNKVEKMIKK